MTDTLIQTLEEKVMMLLAELEDLRFEVQQLKQENSQYQIEKANYTHRLQGLISLLDTADTAINTTISTSLQDEMESMER